MSISKSRENWSVVPIVANQMPLGLMLERRTWLSCFLEMDLPMGEMSGGAEVTGCGLKIEETVGALVIIKGRRGEGQADQDAGCFVALHDLLVKEE